MSSASENAEAETPKTETLSLTSIIHNAVVFNSFNVTLLVIICVLVFKIYKSLSSTIREKPVELDLPILRKDMTVEELKKYDGTQPDGRVLVAVNGYIFDATRGRRFYGPGGPYAEFGGKDATRGLATFSVMSSDKEYDDLSDLNSEQMESVMEWEAQFRDKYHLVGRLLKPGEEPRSYSDEEPEDTDTSTNSPAEEKKEL